MSVKQMPVRVDDLDGTVLYDEGRQTTIILDGEKAELDLSMKNYNQLKELLAPYFKAGAGGSSARRTVAAQKTNDNNNGGTTSAPSRSTTRNDLTAIREWATRNGYKVSARGRIPYSVMDAYARSHVAAS